MILIDFSSISIATILKTGKQTELTNKIIKHIILNNIMSIRKRFFNDYGEIVICCDSKELWRRDVFPYYKAARKGLREKMVGVDWELVYSAMAEVIDDLSNNFPYLVLKTDKAEADDIIAIMVKHANPDEKILIVSNDKDFYQFQIRYQNRHIDQWLPIKKTFYKCSFAEALQDYYAHIVRGDASDGIPNILSDDDAMINPTKRQRRITKNKFQEIVSLIEENKISGFATNLDRNRLLIDLNNIPNEIENSILQTKREIEEDPGYTRNRSKIYNYLVENRLNQLMSEINYF